MADAPNLLNDDGSASMATMLMMSHHAFRRDLARFAEALTRVATGNATRAEALRGEWQSFHAALHGHHTVEDTQIFPDLRTGPLAATVERLSSQHRRIDPLLERGDQAFGGLAE
jgi:hemerythrin-like domain-containing protein